MKTDSATNDTNRDDQTSRHKNESSVVINNNLHNDTAKENQSVDVIELVSMIEFESRNFATNEMKV